MGRENKSRRNLGLKGRRMRKEEKEMPGADSQAAERQTDMEEAGKVRQRK